MEGWVCEPMLSEICGDHDAHVHSMYAYDVSLAHAVLIAPTTPRSFSPPAGSGRHIPNGMPVRWHQP